MKIEYEETAEDLQTRIDIHQQFGSRDIDEWMIETLKPERGIRILDVGCGGGKQCRAFHEYLEGEVEITGGDVSEVLLSQARMMNEELGSPMKFQHLDFNKPFPFEDGHFDLVSCCFAIYYAENAPNTVGEMHRVLKEGGTLFTTGPMPENKRLFYEIIKQATGRSIPPMPGSSRYASEILGAIKDQFETVEEHIFENPLVFHQLQPFLDYTRASLSEDRKIWSSFFSDDKDFEQVMQQIEEVSKARMEEEGKLVMTKVVGGFVAGRGTT